MLCEAESLHYFREQRYDGKPDRKAKEATDPTEMESAHMRAREAAYLNFSCPKVVFGVNFQCIGGIQRHPVLVTVRWLFDKVEPLRKLIFAQRIVAWAKLDSYAVGELTLAQIKISILELCRSIRLGRSSRSARKNENCWRRRPYVVRTIYSILGTNRVCYPVV